MLWLNKRRKLIDTGQFAGRLPAVEPCEMFETLENRMLLYTGAMLGDMPHHNQMENVYHTVIRVMTNMGIIDMEMFDLSAPQTVANFRNYVDQGRLDETIFHLSEPGILQGGAFKFHDDTGASPVATFPPINNEFSRLNTERTIAMAKVPNNPNSATSQFYINLTDNPHLDSENGGHTVFGRVIRGWNIVQTIAGLQTQDLNQELLGTAQGPLGSVPVQQNFPSVGATEESLVRVTDIEVIKNWGSARFYTHSMVMSEGFRGANIVQTLHLQNMDQEIFNFYQIIVRYESGERDQVISRGLLHKSHQRFFLVSDFNLPNYNIVRSNEPYSIEVRSTRAMAVTLNHRDWGVQLEESFVNPTQMARGDLVQWAIPGGQKGPGHQSYITWTNISSEEVRLIINIRAEDGTEVNMMRWVEPYRRGGINVSKLGVVPDGAYSVQIRASDPIVAGLSQYKSGPHGSQAHAELSMGTVGGGATSGVLAGAIIPSDGQAHVDFLYPVAGGQPAQLFIDLEWIYSDGSKDVTTHLIDTNQRNVRIDLGAQNPNAPRDEFFSLRYQVKFEAGRVAASYTSRISGDEVSTAFQTRATRSTAFAHGFSSPPMILNGDMTETISIFNPYKSGVLMSFAYDIVFQFRDGTHLFAAAGDPNTPNFYGLDAHKRRDHVAYSYPHVKAKIDSAPQFRFYSVKVIAAPLSFPVVQGAVVAQLTRTMDSWFQTTTTLPALDGRLPVARLDNTNLFV